MEDAAAWLSTLHGEELMQEAAVPKKIVAALLSRLEIIGPEKARI